MARFKVERSLGAQALESQALRLLSGQERPTARELVELIRQLNPTGRGLLPADCARRYQLKSRLQSLLVRRFGDDLEIAAEASQPGFVLLRHKWLERGDAAHARVIELDEDARSIVLRRLDESIATHEAPPPVHLYIPAGRGKDSQVAADSLLASSPAELVRLGRAAMDAYDYEAARAHLADALRDSSGKVEAALPLCELLVENLGADAEALAVAPLFNVEAASHPAVRALLALAAARSGQPKEAVRWLRGVSDAAAASVWLALAERAILDRVVGEAESALGQARAFGAPPAELLRLTDALTELKRRTWQPVEVELSRQLEAGHLEEALAQAQQLLKEWPESVVGRRVLAFLQAQGRTQERERLQEEAAEALTAGDLALASHKVRAARELGQELPELEEAIAAAQERARKAREQAEIAACVRALSANEQTESADSLRQYLELPAPLRAEVRRATSNPLLDWLEAIERHGTSARNRSSIDAVLALRRAFRAEQPEEVVGALQPHERTLASVDVAQQLLARTRAALLVVHRAQAEQKLEAIAAALDRGQLSSAEQQLLEVELRALDPQGSERMQKLKERLHRQQELLRLNDELQRYLAADDLLRAQAAVATLVELCEPKDRPTWQSQRVEIAERIKQNFCLQEYELGGQDLAELVHLEASLDFAFTQLQTFHCLADGEAVLAQAEGDWLFLFVIDAERATLRRALTLRTPAPLGRVKVVLSEQGLYVLGDAHLLALDRALQTVCFWQDLRTFVAPSQRIEELFVLPEAGYLWVRTGTDSPDQVTVVDTRRWRVRRELLSGVTLSPFISRHGVGMASLGWESGAKLFDASGAAGDAVGLPARLTLALASHPSGSGALGLLAEPTLSAEEELGRLALVESASKHKDLLLARSDYEAPCALVTSFAEDTAFVSYSGAEGTELHAYRARPTGLEQVWQRPYSPRLVFLQDLGGARVFALSPSSSGPRLVQLGSSPPVLPNGDVAPWHGFPDMGGHLWCLSGSFEMPPQLETELAQLAPAERPPEYFDFFRVQHAADLNALLAVYLRIPHEQRRGHLDFIERHYGGVPALAYLRADLAVEEHAWAEARRLMATLKVEQLPERSQRHFLHILGCVKLREGDVRGARRTWRRASERPGLCRIDSCIEWLDALDAVPRRIDNEVNPTRLHVLARGLLLADRCLASGDFAGTCRALEQSAILSLNEGQSLARLAAAYLNLTPAGRLPFLHKATALACFCTWQKSDWERHEVYLPQAQWEKEKMMALEKTATAWLRDNLGVPMGPSS
jgi:hypothetical protein